MIKELPYTSSIKDMPLMFREMKRTALLLLEGKSCDEIVGLSMEKNIYQLDKEKRRRDVPRRMIKRLSYIGQPLVDVIACGIDSSAKLIAFLALMKADRLLFEYMREVYSDVFAAGQDEITDRDFSEFIERKAQNSNVVASWTTNSLTGIRGKIKTSLCDAGLAKRTKNGLFIQPPIADKELCEVLGENDRVYAKAMLLED